MPRRLRPTAPVAPAAILVGDPGRALMLAQELLEQPRMSNHARGLWGYTGERPGGEALTIQATGMGGPSAALVLADLAKLGVSRVVRIGSCVGFAEGPQPGGLLLVSEAVAAGGSAAAFGIALGESVRPDRDLEARLAAELGDSAAVGRVASFDAMPEAGGAAGCAAGDMQTVAVLARAEALQMAAGAVLVVSEGAGRGDPISDERLEQAARSAGAAAAAVL